MSHAGFGLREEPPQKDTLGASDLGHEPSHSTPMSI